MSRGAESLRDATEVALLGETNCDLCGRIDRTYRSCIELFRFVGGFRVTCGINVSLTAADGRLYQVSVRLSLGFGRRPADAW